ncbi:hypothetical protein UFOVP112_153 [uncultured Caudovirales phage]|uniref:Uncharacterized protein n=1 Tax=uncultured Caudovirales phage TaxID=2100421 RepID=A0A6J5L5A2_9CAUD|nr:hypothetical protein UFOVP112_153 [uncultured Caudovirales phage]
MAITDSQKVDYLFKKLGYGVAKTDTSTAKSPANESVSSPLLIRSDTLWTQSDQIVNAAVLPTANTSVLSLYRDTLSSTIQTVNDGTAATNRTWKTNLADWVGPEFGAGYSVKVYAGPASSATPQNFTQLPADGSGSTDSWYFDYQSGVLNFADTNVPTAVTGNVVYVVGARYTGTKGLATVGNLTITSNISAGNITATGNIYGNFIGTATTANVSMYDSFTASTTNATFYPQMADKATGNGAAYTASTLTHNPSTGVLSATQFSGAGNFTTAVVTNLSSGNVQLTGGNATTLTNFSGTTGQATNFSTANAAITGAQTYIGTGAALIANAYVGTGYFTNLSSANARIATGYADNFPIGANTRATGAFTTLATNGIVTATGGTDATSTSTGQLQVTGGVGITGNLWVGGNIYAANIIATTQNIITVQDPLLYLQASNPYGTYNYDIGFYSDYSAPYYVHSGLARSVASNVWIFFSNVQSEPQATSINWNDTGLIYDTVKSGALILANTTAATGFTSTTGGALQVAGGASVQGALYALGLNATTGNVTTLQSTNFSTSNAAITGAQTYIGTGSTLIANIYAGTGYFTNLSVSNISGIANESVTTLVATNFSSGNAVISGGYISSLTNATMTTTTVTNETATNFYTANARIQGGYIQNLANITAVTGYIVNENITNGNVTTLYAQNLNSGNAAITGAQTYIGTGAALIANAYVGTGYFTNLSVANISGVTNESVTTLVATNFSTANAQITGGTITGLTNLTATTAQATNFSTGNASITGAQTYIGSGGTLIANAYVGTSYATNFSTANARVTGGYADNFPIGANTASTGAFTTLTNSGVNISNGNLVAASGTASTSITTGALVVAGSGGLGVGGNINAGTFGTSLHNIKGNVLIGQGSVIASADSAITINENTDTPLTSNATVHLSAMTNKSAVYGADSFGTTATSIFFGRHARGNSTTPSAVQLNDAIAGFVGKGYGASGFAYTPSLAQIPGLAIFANENHTDTAQGTYLTLSTTPNGSVNAVTGLQLTASGNIVIPTSTASTTPTTGALVVIGGVGIGGQASVFSNVLVGGGGLTTSNTIGYVFNETATTINAFGAATTLNIGNASGTTTIAGVTKHSGNLVAASGTTSTGTTTGALVVTGGIGVSGNINIGSNLVVTGTTTHTGATTFSSTITSTGNIVAASQTNSTSSTTGALTVVGGAGVQANVFVGGATTLGSNRTAGYDTIVQGKNDASLIWARSGSTYDQVVIGNSATASTLVTGAKLHINSTDSIILPTGSTSQRPSSSGGTDVIGMLRFSTASNTIEYYTGTQWATPSAAFAVITDEQFNGDGTTTVFTLGGSSTTAATIVSINGIVQIPTLSYGVSGVTLTLTEAPQSGDLIDVRRLSSTTTVTSVASTNGFMQFAADNSGAQIWTGSSGTSVTTYWEPGGAKVNSSGNTTVSSANVATAIDSFSTTTYRSARYVVQVTNGAKYQVSEAMVLHNGTTPSVVEYGILQTNGNLGVLTASIASTTLTLNFVGTFTSSNVRITKDYNII